MYIEGWHGDASSLLTPHLKRRGHVIFMVPPDLREDLLFVTPAPTCKALCVWVYVYAGTDTLYSF